MSSSLPRIVHIQAIPLQEGDPATPLNSARNAYTLVRITTDTGLVGVGSCYTSADLVEAALGQMAHLLENEIAIEPQRVHEKLEQSGFWWGRGGTITHTISGIDIALWDILGQAAGQPVARLLGGIYRNKVKPYASLSMGRGDDLLRQALHDALDRSFHAFKIGWGRFGRTGNADDDEAIIKLVRDIIGDCDLMVDPGGSQQFWPHGYKWALRTADMLADYGVTWFEEPLAPDDLDGYKLLREHARVMISGGEVLTRRQSFEPFLEGGALDVVQPDCTKVGGLTEAANIARMAYRHHVMTVPHGWNTAVGLYADLHLVASLPVGKWVEFHQPTEVIDGILAEPLVIGEDGLLDVPDGPGLGIDINWDAVAELSHGRYRA